MKITHIYNDTPINYIFSYPDDCRLTICCTMVLNKTLLRLNDFASSSRQFCQVSPSAQTVKRSLPCGRSLAHVIN